MKMGIETLLLNDKSEKGNAIFATMLKWLDNPTRRKYNNPDKLLEASGIQQGQTVLEIGCGSGFFTIPASKLVGEKGKLYSIDIHTKAVEETQKKVDIQKLKNVVVKKDNAMNSSFEDSSFDLILLYGVVPAPVISMKDLTLEIHRLLKPGGICAIWSMFPFWSPRAALSYASFGKIEKHNGVFLLRKI